MATGSMAAACWRRPPTSTCFFIRPYRETPCDESVIEFILFLWGSEPNVVHAAADHRMRASGSG